MYIVSFNIIVAEHIIVEDSHSGVPIFESRPRQRLSFVNFNLILFYLVTPEMYQDVTRTCIRP